MEKVETKIIPAAELEKNLDDVARRVRDGAIVIYPTDTVYGVGASLEQPDQIRRIFKIKGRTLRKPMALLVSRIELVEEYVREVTPEAKKLMEAFWPGPMTLVLPVKKDAVPEVVNGGGDSIGVRIPDHKDAIRLLDACGGVLATTSANTSQDDDATTFEMARSYFEGKVE
ncbi:MAG: L-threonylcarbamoyladenylate synthase, partial [bacterium]